LGLLLILLLETSTERFAPHRGNKACQQSDVCGQNSTMPYISTQYENPVSFDHTNDGPHSYTHAHYKVIPQYVPAPYSKVWRNEPVFHDEFSRQASNYTISNNEPDYNLTHPFAKEHHNDTDWVENTAGSGGCERVSAFPAVQSAFMRDSLTFRNNIMGDYVDQFEQQREHNCVDFRPGRPTF